MMAGRNSIGIGIVGLLVLTTSGCVSLDEHNRLKAAHRNMSASKESLQQQLFDLRATVDAMKVRNEACERDLRTTSQMLASVRGENELLDQMRRDAAKRAEEIANMPIGDITIAGAKLPERLDSALKQFAQQYPSEVEYDAAAGTVKWKSDLLFALGSDVVRESSTDSLRRFTEILNSSAASGFEVIVVGHTDNRPISRPETREKHPTNWHLSAHRAIAVSNVLQRFSYPSSNIAVMGCGEYRPVASNASQDGSARNRRVEIYLVPSGTIVRTASAQGSSGGSMAVDRNTK